MADRDFKELNDKEFEELCSDLLSKKLGYKIERFKPGKDAGVDGRFFSGGNEVILQYKHWANTEVAKLVRYLRKEEKAKLDKLKPSRYLLAVSNKLSRKEKKEIFDLLQPYIKSQDDIFGQEDLNDILKDSPEILKNHYKLWLYSIDVLQHLLQNSIIGRSAYSLEEIRESSCRYVKTENHDRALRQLESLGVVIITGEPGIGKTTLADHLCVDLVAEGYEYLKISKDIKEAESSFLPENKQVFYFDDFLGRNYLEALSGHEGNEITQFIRRVSKNKNKRFVLTSRSTILNQGKLLIDSFQHDNLKRNEYELKITTLSSLDKARILYNHIWYAGLEASYVEELYKEKRYHQIIRHKNFNPRLISYITDSTRLDGVSPEDYWAYIQRSLANPSQVWENPFEAQQDDFARAIVLLAVLHGGKITENQLSECYQEYISMPGGSAMKGRQDFRNNIRTLTGSFLNRYIQTGQSAELDLFNPSIGDYVLARYTPDLATLKNAFACLRSTASLRTLVSLKNNRMISVADFTTIIEYILDRVVVLNFSRTSTTYLAEVITLYLANGISNSEISQKLIPAADFVYQNYETVTTDVIRVVRWLTEHKHLAFSDALAFIETISPEITQDDELSLAWAFLDEIPKTTVGYEKSTSAFDTRILEYISEDLDGFISTADVFGALAYGDYDTAEEKLIEKVIDKLSDLGIPSSHLNLNAILEDYDVHNEMNEYFQNSWEPDYERHYDSSAASDSISEIDDLFDRS